LKSAFFALIGVCSLTFAIPLLGTLGEGATFFVAHRAEAGDILLLVLVIYILPPAILIGVVYAISLATTRAVATVFASIVLGLLATLWAGSHALVLPTAGAMAIGLAFGALVTWTYLTRSSIRSFLNVLGQVSPVIVIFFVAFTPVKKLIFPDSVATIAASGGAGIPVVMVIFDELSMAALVAPDGGIDAGRLPNFARLARMSTWYRDATTISTQTRRAIPAILSGTLPAGRTVPVYSQYPQNLFTLLGYSHHIHALEAISRLCPKRLCKTTKESPQAKFNPRAMYTDVGYVWLHTVLPPDLARLYLPPISNGWRDFGGGDIARARAENARFGRLTEAIAKHKGIIKVPGLRDIRDNRFRKFLAGIQLDSDASLDFIHMTLPHHPWIRFPDGTVYNGESPPGLTESDVWRNNQDLADQAILQYALQVEYVDKLLGELLDQLEESGRLSETLLIVLADHGLAIAPGMPIRQPETSTVADVSRIPLFIKYPGQRAGKQDLRKAQTIDVLPTIADALNLELPSAVDGRSLLSDSWQEVERGVVEARQNALDIDSAMDMKRASERIYSVIEPGHSALEALGTNNTRELIGTAAHDITAAESELTLQLENSQAYANLDLESDILPALLSGQIAGARPGTEILIALNNTFSGSGTTYDDQGSVSILLDPRQFREGFNELAAYEVDGEGLSRLDIDAEVSVE
jgi:hypothetical protein